MLARQSIRILWLLLKELTLMKQRISNGQSNWCRIGRVHGDARCYRKFNIPYPSRGQRNIKQNIMNIKIGGGILEAEMKGYVGLRRKQQKSTYPSLWALGVWLFLRYIGRVKSLHPPRRWMVRASIPAAPGGAVISFMEKQGIWVKISLTWASVPPCIISLSLQEGLSSGWVFWFIFSSAKCCL